LNPLPVVLPELQMGLVFFFEEPAARARRVYINREEVLQNLIKKQKQNPHKGGNNKTTTT
jgi:hypothetical protein